MFRQEEIFVGGWKEKTLEAMHSRRFESVVAQLPQLGAERLSVLSTKAFERKLERCWQDIPKKPLRAQQEAQVWETILGHIDAQADCLSRDEHELVERALILGGCARIEDMQELEAAQALSLRLLANVGLVSGKPYVELERAVMEPLARAFARPEHEIVQRRFDAFYCHVSGLLYCVGALDDRQPQQMILRDVLGGAARDELSLQLARRYLWASFDCVDYSDGVMLLHAALAEPQPLIRSRRRRRGGFLPSLGDLVNGQMEWDILPEEIPLQRRLECAIEGAMRAGTTPREAATTIRFLCKQGAPLSALEEVLQSFLLVYLSPAMRGALTDLFVRLPKWLERGGFQ